MYKPLKFYRHNTKSLDCAYSRTVLVFSVHRDVRHTFLRVDTWYNLVSQFRFLSSPSFILGFNQDCPLAFACLQGYCPRKMSSCRDCPRERASCRVSAGSHLSCTGVLTGSKRLRAVSTGAKYVGQSRQEAKSGGLGYPVTEVTCMYYLVQTVRPI